MPTNDLWQTSIERLRTEFEEAAREFPDLRVVLWRIPKNLGEIVSRGVERPASTAELIANSTQKTLRQGVPLAPFGWSQDVLENNLQDVFMFCGRNPGRRRYEELGARAVNCAAERLAWLSPPYSVDDQLEGLRTHPHDNALCPENLWTLALFGLAWQKRSGIDLSAPKDQSFALLAGFPGAWVSYFPCDAFTASLVAIDVLIATEKPVTPSVPNKPCNRYEKLKALRAAQRKAYYSFLYAESKAEKRLEDREAHDLLQEEGIAPDEEESGELVDYELPAFDTWSRQVRSARKALGEQKYTPRRGRSTSRSIVKGGEIDHQNSGDG